MAELDFIDMLRKRRGNSAPDLKLGIGDDCAVVKKNSQTSLLYTMDSLVSGVHFNLDFHPLYLLGRKTIAVNISDIAAMGGEPKYGLLSICLPSSFTEPDQQEFMNGFFSSCDEFGVELIGGDTVSGSALELTVTLIGEMKTTALCTRSGGQASDEVWVSGDLGASSVGLQLLQNSQADLYPELVRAHLDPIPQVALGRLLAASGLVTSMMDISDGVATDLAHLCQQNQCGALIDGSLVPISAIMREGAAFLGVQPLDQALCGGEDYQLLFTLPAGRGEGLARQVRDALGLVITAIGVLDDGRGVRLMDGKTVRDISFQGYEHT
jgi:thiamine-monophosphate kinase